MSRNFMANAGFHATLSIDWWNPVTLASPGQSDISITHCTFADSGEDSSNWTPMGHIVRGPYLTDTVPDADLTVTIEHVVVSNVKADIINVCARLDSLHKHVFSQEFTDKKRRLAGLVF